MELLEQLAKYNLWDNKSFDNGFLRTGYLQRIKKYTGNRLVKVLVGQRRSGKSYLIRQIMQSLVDDGVNPENLFYFNTEYLYFDEIGDAKDLQDLFDLYLENKNPKGKVYIFIDEIQNICQWQKFVNSYSQEISGNYELFITGSNSELLSGELASLLSGRYMEFEIFPFDYEETCCFFNITPGRKSFSDYLQNGGLPELHNLPDDETRRNYVNSLKNTIILRDIIKRHAIHDAVLLEDILKFVFTNAGNLTSITKIVNVLKPKNRKSNYETVSNYLDYLKQTFIIREALRYNIRGKKLLGGQRKYYINDSGFKTHLFGFYPEDRGSLLENYVYLFLKQKGYQVYVGEGPKGEIDFIAQKDNESKYIQVAWNIEAESTFERETGNMLSLNDNYDKYLITMDEEKYSDYKGIKHLHPWVMHKKL